MNEATLIANSKVVFACSKGLENSATLGFRNATLKLVTKDLFVNPARISIANSDIYKYVSDIVEEQQEPKQSEPGQTRLDNTAELWNSNVRTLCENKV
jgi:hypothetical protein